MSKYRPKGKLSQQFFIVTIVCNAIRDRDIFIYLKYRGVQFKYFYMKVAYIEKREKQDTNGKGFCLTVI